MLRPHPRIFGSGTQVFKPASTRNPWGLKKILVSGSLCQRLLSSLAQLWCTSGFVKAPRLFWCTALQWLLYIQYLLLERSPFSHPVASLVRGISLLGYSTWFTEVRLEMVSLTSPIMPHIMTLRFSSVSDGSTSSWSSHSHIAQNRPDPLSSASLCPLTSDPWQASFLHHQPFILNGSLLLFFALVETWLTPVSLVASLD